MQRDGQDGNFQLPSQSSVGEQGTSPAVRDFEQGNKGVVKHQQYLLSTFLVQNEKINILFKVLFQV